MELAQALCLIREVPDFPKPGIRFQDITPLLGNGRALRAVSEHFASFSHEGDLIAGIEARGFIFAAALANQTQAGLIPIRKKGKLPFQTISQGYGLEYGSDELEMHIDAFTPGSKVLLIDDVLATGGTISAAISLIQRCGGEVVCVLALLEIESLGGRANLFSQFPAIPVKTLKTV